MKDYESLTTHVAHKLKGTRILISSILPMKNLRLTAPIINKINAELENMCKEKGFYFLNSSYFKNAKELYHDEVHLNSKGAVTFGSNLKKCLCNLLSISERADEHYFRHGHQHKNQPVHRHTTPRRGPRTYPGYYRYQTWQTMATDLANLDIQTQLLQPSMINNYICLILTIKLLTMIAYFRKKDLMLCILTFIIFIQNLMN